MADAIVANFEQNGIKCWYAPRDIMPGQEWVSAINEGLHSSKVVVLIYTDESNQSRQVMNEIALAFNAGITIVPFRLTENEMSDEFEYYLTRVHWLDALSKPLSKNIDALREYVEVILQKPHEETEESSQAGNVKKKTKKKWVLPAAVAAALLVIAAGVFCFLKFGRPDKEELARQQIEELMEEGKEHYYTEYHGTEDNAKARECFEQAAELGEAEAYYFLGQLDERDYEFQSAVKNYEIAIDNDCYIAATALAGKYRLGYGVEQNVEKARELCEEAVDNDCPDGYLGLGRLVAEGQAGFDPDAQKALKYYEKALKSDSPEDKSNALISIGDLYKNGYAGVERDYDEAEDYYLQAMEAYPYCTGSAYERIASLYVAQDENVFAEDYYGKALKFYEKAADAGDLTSINAAGYLYSDGKGTEADGEKAMDYYRKAADAGNTWAMTNIGRLYENGGGNVVQNYDKAYEWYRKAADKDHGPAMREIGDLYYNGHYGAEGDDRDYRSARQWYQKAADEGDVTAYSELGNMYRDGTSDGAGGEPDYVKMMEQYRKGENAGSETAIFYIGYSYYMGYTEDGKTDFETASRYFEKAANMGLPNAMRALGIMYSNGDLGEPDPQTARDWYLRAADEGDAVSMQNLGFLYYNGALDGKKDYDNALKWFEKAAEKSDPDAMDMIGYMYECGLGLEVDLKKAEEWYLKAEENYKGSATEDLCRLYYENDMDGDGKKDYTESFKYGSAAIDSGSVIYYKTYERIGKMYRYANGTGVDFDRAYDMFTKAYEMIKESGKGDLDGDTWYILAYSYAVGEYGVEMDIAKATYFAQKAAEAGDEDGMLLIAVYYEAETATETNRKKALYWYARALEKYNETGDEAASSAADGIDGMIDEGTISRDDIQALVDNGDVKYDTVAQWLE